MNYILFDGTVRNALLPFTFTRPVADIRIGILTIREKWEKYLGTTTTTLTEEYLSEKFPMVEMEENVMINASFLPNDILAEMVKSLEPNQAIFKGDIVSFPHQVRRFNEDLLRQYNSSAVDDVLNAKTLQHPIDTVLLSTLASLVVRKDLHPLIKRRIASTTLALHEPAGLLHHAGEFPHLRRLDFEASPQARQVFQGDMPWIETQLSPAHAQWVYRLLFLGLPLLGLGFLASQIVPSLLRWRLERQVNQWYGELKFIENDISDAQATGMQMARIRAKLRSLGERVNALKAPRAFHQRLFQLKQSIHFVTHALERQYGR